MEPRYGSQVPTHAVVIPYASTLGIEAVDLYRKTGNKEYPWQSTLINDMMAVDEDGLWVHQKFGYAVPRRNGKSEDAIIRCLYELSAGRRTLYTAHRASTSHAIWERLDRMVTAAGLSVDSSFKAFGKEHIYTANGGVIEFRTRTSSGGLGEGYDLLVIDEAQEYTDAQETALKYVVTDSDNPQTIMLGTPPTAVSSGTVFMKYRDTVLTGSGFESGWFEWSVDHMTDPQDVDAWYLTNPSLGYKLKERAIRSELSEDEIDFNIQRLGLWLRYNQKSAISKTEWEALAAETLPELSGKLYVGVKFGHDNQNVSMAIAAKTKDGRIFIEAIDCQPIRNGLAWILEFLDKADTAKVVVDGANGQALLKDAMRDYGLKAPVLPTVKEIIKANAVFEQDLASQKLVHMNQPSLTQAASNCDKRAIGSNGGFGYQSQREGIDISLLDSVILAHWACAESKGKVTQQVYY